MVGNDRDGLGRGIDDIGGHQNSRQSTSSVVEMLIGEHKDEVTDRLPSTVRPGGRPMNQVGRGQDISASSRTKG